MSSKRVTGDDCRRERRTRNDHGDPSGSIGFTGRENGEDYGSEFLVMLNTWEAAVKFLRPHGRGKTILDIWTLLRGPDLQSWRHQLPLRSPSLSRARTCLSAGKNYCFDGDVPGKAGLCLHVQRSPSLQVQTARAVPANFLFVPANRRVDSSEQRCFATCHCPTSASGAVSQGPTSNAHSLRGRRCLGDRHQMTRPEPALRAKVASGGSTPHPLLILSLDWASRLDQARVMLSQAIDFGRGGCRHVKSTQSPAPVPLPKPHSHVPRREPSKRSPPPSRACAFGPSFIRRFQALADSDHCARRPAAATSRGDAPARQLFGRSGGRQTREWDKRRTQTLGEGASTFSCGCSAGGAVRLALTQLGMAGTAERDQVPLVIAAGFAAGDEVMVLQIIGRTTGGAEGELHCFALSIRSRIRCTDFGPCPVTAPIARYAAPSRRMAFIRSITAISAAFGTKRLMSPSRTMS